MFGIEKLFQPGDEIPLILQLPCEGCMVPEEMGIGEQLANGVWWAKCEPGQMSLEHYHSHVVVKHGDLEIHVWICRHMIGYSPLQAIAELLSEVYGEVTTAEGWSGTQAFRWHPKRYTWAHLEAERTRCSQCGKIPDWPRENHILHRDHSIYWCSQTCRTNHFYSELEAELKHKEKITCVKKLQKLLGQSQFQLLQRNPSRQVLRSLAKEFKQLATSQE